MSTNETTDIILQALARIEAKVDAQAVENGKIGERLAALEANSKLYDTQFQKLQEEMADLQARNNRGMGGLQTLLWIIATGLAAASFLLK